MEEVYNKEPLIYTGKNIQMLKDVPVLDDGSFYIYVMLNYPQGYIKIGKTTNIQQRLQSLSGSNGGGNKIIKLYCSPATWVQSIETALHSYYHKYRIKDTEWFKGDVLDFNKVVNHINGLFYTNSYNLCNNIRKNIAEEEKRKLELEKMNQPVDEDAINKKSKKKKK